jgi:hypothetical protein
MASFFLSPSSGVINAAVPLVITGIGTAFTQLGSGFVVSGGNGAQIQGVTIISDTQAVLTLDTGTIAGELTVEEVVSLLTAQFLVTGSAGAVGFTYDTTTLIGQVRLKIGDIDISTADPTIPRDQWSCLFSDQEIQVFLNDTGSDIDFAAIEALRYLTARPQMQVRAINTMNLNMEIGDLVGTLNTLADNILRSRAMVPDEEIAEVGLTKFSLERIVKNAIMRRGQYP